MNRFRSSRLPNDTGAPHSWLLPIVCALTLPGCHLLNWSSAWFSLDNSGSKTHTTASPLKQIPTSRSAVTLEIVFVERPEDDPLLGKRLWDEVEEIGSISPEEGETVSQIGFRVGRVGANPPPALQTLMGLATDVVSHDEKRLVGRRVVLPSGAETEISTGVLKPHATVKLPASDGTTQIKSFENLRGVVRMKAKRLQDGWVRIEFLPEIHHGRVANRPVAVQGNWQVATAQAIERLYQQKFALNLNMGEMVVITGRAEPADSVGRNFFHSPQYSDTMAASYLETGEPIPQPAGNENGPGIQRLLIVRLADLSTAESIYSEQ